LSAFEPTRAQLRTFGALWLPAALCAAAYSQQAREATVRALLAAAGCSLALGLVRPLALRPIFRASLLVTAPVRFVVGSALLGAIFYGVVTPIGLLARRLRADPMARGFDRAAASYWRTPDGRDFDALGALVLRKWWLLPIFLALLLLGALLLIGSSAAAPLIYTVF
jgi:hypothetical protein